MPRGISDEHAFPLVIVLHGGGGNAENAARMSGMSALNVECKPTQPVAVIAFHGTADQHVLYDGGAPKVKADPHPREDKSVAYAMNFWAQHNRCAAPPKRDERGNIVHDTYTNCVDGTAVELHAIKGEGHTWPGGKSYPRGDDPTAEISATDVM